MATVGQQLTAPEAGWRRYDNYVATYIGSSWVNSSSANTYGSNELYTNDPANSLIRIVFTGTKIRLIATMSTSKNANLFVSIDGVNYPYSQYSSTSVWQALSFEATGLPQGTHSVIITGTGSTTMGLDAFDIDSTGSVIYNLGLQLSSPESGWNRFDNSHGSLNYVGSGWNVETNAVHYNGSLHWSRTVGDSVKFQFRGTKIRLITDRNTNRSSYTQSITIDGVKEWYNTYGATQAQTLTYEKLGLEDKVHDVEIKNESDNISLDAIDTDGYLIISVGKPLPNPDPGWRRYDETDSRIRYSGSGWTSWALAGANNGNIKGTTNSNDSFTFKFYGTQFRLITSSRIDRSQTISIVIDGVAPETIAFGYDASISAGNSPTPAVLGYERRGLSKGNHTVTLSLNDTNSLTIDAIDIDDFGQLESWVGQQVIAPELGWKRYDANTSTMLFSGTWASETNTAYYNSTYFYTNTSGSNVKFKFSGTKIRVISTRNSGHSANISISIDGVSETFSEKGALTHQVLLYEKFGLPNDVHTVEINSNDTEYLTIDAVDIDIDGRLLHPDEVINVTDLTVGKRIRCHYTAASGVVGAFSNIGLESAEFISASSSASPNGDFYFIMFEEWNGKKRLIADRSIQHTISWDALNNEGITSGKVITLGYSLIPKMTSNILPKGKASASTTYPTVQAYYAFDKINENESSSAWITNATSTGWLEYEFESPVIVNQYMITGQKAQSGGSSVAEITARHPKTWTFEGYNESTSSWDVLDARADVTSWFIGSPKVFNIANKKEYKRYRINITANNGSTYTAIGELELLRQEETFSFTLRLPTGGTTTTDKDNEWDRYIVNSTLNDTIVAGSNSVWNWSGIYSVTSTTQNSAGSRTVRGKGSVSENSYVSTSNATATQGFRPMLEIVTLNIIKSFIKTSDGYKKWDGEWKIISTTLPSINTFISDGMRFLDILDRASKTIIQDTVAGGEIGVGKIFKSTLDLNKLVSINSIKMKEG